MPTELVLACTVNKEPARRLVPASRTLLEFLREDLDLTGSKHGCDVGDCGACTVLLDGQPALACITLAAACEGASIDTIEGVAQGTELHPVQAAFDRHVAAQCGYCTPGFVMNLVSLLHENTNRTDDELKHAIGSNICRCTGYIKILAAAKEARDAMVRPP